MRGRGRSEREREKRERERERSKRGREGRERSERGGEREARERERERRGTVCESATNCTHTYHTVQCTYKHMHETNAHFQNISVSTLVKTTAGF